jgi:hypothetical protein
MDGYSSNRTAGGRSHRHQKAAGTGGSRKNDGMGMNHLWEGAWFDAKSAQYSFGDEHAYVAKRPRNLTCIGLPDIVTEAIRDIPRDCGGENHKKLLFTFMAAGGIRLRGHGKPITLLDTLGQHILSPVCQG